MTDVTFSFRVSLFFGVQGMGLLLLTFTTFCSVVIVILVLSQTDCSLVAIFY